jgi:hypothetical protein
MTTLRDHGRSEVQMLRCSLDDYGPNLYPTLRLALRDMRQAGGRDLVDGSGTHNWWWPGLALGMIVLDTMSGDEPGAGRRFRALLIDRGITKTDAQLLWALRCSLLHGYGLPRLQEWRMFATREWDAYALDTSREGLAVLSIPVFCGRLVERIVSEMPDRWDVTLLDTDAQIPGTGGSRWATGSQGDYSFHLNLHWPPNMPPQQPPDEGTH